nr:glucuronate isomerase [Cohnella zeiphila]
MLHEILELEVVDTHTHLVGDRLCAKDFWEIAHYFWFYRELQAGGYPNDAERLPEDERISAFLDAYRATANTLMNWVFTKIMNDLYGVRIRDANSVREADEAVRGSSVTPGWARRTAAKMRVREFAVNIPEHADFRGMDRPGILIPRIDGKIHEWMDTVHRSPDPAGAFEQAQAEAHALIDGFREMNCPGIMTTLPRYDASANQTYSFSPGMPSDQVLMLLLHSICRRVEENGMLLQLFLGVERSWSAMAFPANDPARILKLSALFERYRCPFELVVASEINNLDVVQAAWNFPNVHVGGMWWFNFRASTYKAAMQYRLEALPALKSSLVVSDARCIEWSYGKILLVKHLLSEFLSERIEAGWLDNELALQVARDWLYGSAAQRYGVGVGS